MQGRLTLNPLCSWNDLGKFLPLSLSSESWDYRHVLPSPALSLLLSYNKLPERSASSISALGAEVSDEGAV